MSDIPAHVLMSLRILEFFELPPGQIPTKQGLKDNYIRLARRHHPDRGGSHEAMKAVNRAYEVVSKWRQEVMA